MSAEKLYPFYMLLCRYYEGEMCGMEYGDFRALILSVRSTVWTCFIYTKQEIISPKSVLRREQFRSASGKE